MNVPGKTLQSVALEESLMPLRWAAWAVGAVTLALAGWPRPASAALILAAAGYCAVLQGLARRRRLTGRLARLLPVIDGLVVVHALLLVRGTLNPFTPLLALALASVPVRLPRRPAFALSAALLGLLALGLHVHPGKALDGYFGAFAALNLLIVWLVAALAGKADWYRMSLDDLNSVLDHFPCGVIIEQDRRIYANAYVRQALGLPPADPAEADIRQARHDALLARVWELVRKRTPPPRPAGPSEPSEVVVPAADETARVFTCQRMLIKLASGAVAEVATLLDVTEQRAMQLKLLEQERLRLLGTLTGMAVHEIRNTLAAIRATAQVLSVQSDPAGVREHAARIMRSADQLHTFLVRLVDLGRAPVEKGTVCDVGNLVREVAALMTPVAQRAGVRLVAGEPLEMTIPGDHHALQQVLINLVQNGIDACKSDGTVTVSARYEDGTVVFAVADDGEGIPEEVAERVFAPFVTTKEKGTGLGLAISKQIIDEHGGRLWFESGPGGTTFYVGLPAGADDTERRVS